MKKYVIAETVTHYHMVEIDDELNIEDVVETANPLLSLATGFKAIEDILQYHKEEHGFDYTVKPNYCGTCSEGLEIAGCEDDSPELD